MPFATLRRDLALCALVILLAMVAGAPAEAQTYRFTEDFENIGSVSVGQQGPTGLMQSGWTFRNQSTPGSTVAAWSPNGVAGWPYTGSGFLRGEGIAAGMFANLSHWAILPPTPDVLPGDIFTLWALDGAYATVPTYIEVRRSPTGATGTGSGPTDVGDFTELLYSAELPVSVGVFDYAPIQFTLPAGSAGRLAIRFQAPYVSNLMSSPTLYLDSLTIGDPPGPPCGLVMPAAGETIVWDASGSPYEVCMNLLVPAGATLQIEPGATVTFAHGTELRVEGALQAIGTALNPITLGGDNVSGLSVSGAVEIAHAQIDCWFQFRSGGEAQVSDSQLGDTAWLGATAPDTALTMSRCDVYSEVFSGAGADHYSDVQFLNPGANINLGRIARVDGVASVAPIEYTVHGQTRLIENVTISGVAGAAITVGVDQTGSADVLLDGTNGLTGNGYPIWIRGGGLHPGSVIPASGNTNNALRAPFALGSTSDVRSLATLPDVGVPYHVLEDAQLSGRVDFEPGAVFRLAAGVALDHRNDNGIHPRIRGLPGQPIRFERLDPAEPWAALSSTLGFNIWEHLEIDGAGVGAAATGSYIELRDCTISNSALHGARPGNRGIIYGSGNRFLDNAVGVHCDTSIEAWGSVSGIRFDGAERPNVFQGNALAAACPANPLGVAADDMAMENNWWGDSTGPHEPLSHPAGQGDPVDHPVLYSPWLSQPPDLSIHRPAVRLVTRLHPVARPGDKIFIEWTAVADRAITGFDIEMLVPPVIDDEPSWLSLASGLPPHTRRFELTVPVRPAGSPKQALFRILAHDVAGEIGLEHFWLLAPDQLPPGTALFHSDLSQEMLFDGRYTLCYTALQPGGQFPKLYIDLDADMRTLLEGGISPGSNVCTSGNDSFPMASTDRARFVIRFEGNDNDDYFYFSDYFTIRPDPRLGDAAPQVQLVSPAPGQSFPGGGVIPIAWTASDDDFVREVRIQASTNGGYTYHTIADGLPGADTDFDWVLPDSSGVADVRVRIVAIDKRFQNSSAEVAIAVTPGAGGGGCLQPFIRGELNGDGAVDIADGIALLGFLFGGGSAPQPLEAGDVNTDGSANIADVIYLLGYLFSGGPPPSAPFPTLGCP